MARFNAKLTEDDVLFILDGIRSGRRGAQIRLADEFDVTQQTISEIATGQSWSHVTGIVHEPRPRAKITPETVLKIDADLKAGLSNSQISEKYALHAGTVSQIKNGKRWANVTGRPNRRPHN